MKKILLFVLVSVSVTSFFLASHYAKPLFKSTQSIPKLKDGDLIFQVNPSGQGKAIQLSTGSQFTHCGIIFIEDGVTYVYHAVEPVQKSTVKDFVSMGTNGEYWVKRLNRELKAAELKEMKEYAKAQLGKHYDFLFKWNDNEMYCSEYIWKIYHNGAGVEIGNPKKLKEYSLDRPEVRTIMNKRYGNTVPWDEQMIAPGDIYASMVLKTVR